MKIAIMATGGVGGYFGARLAAVGEDVHFIARRQHLAALRANGLVLKSANGDLHLRSVSATDDPAKDKAFSTLTGQNQPFELRLEMEFRVASQVSARCASQC
jgi:hypothetical protein